MTVNTLRFVKNLAACGATGLILLSAPVHAEDLARVISSVAIIQQVSVPRQVCSTQQVMVEQPRSGAGALLGAVAGGAAGNAIGDGSGRTAATMLGIVGGAILGNRIEGSPGTRMQEQTTCSTQNIYENRTVGYNVTYEYAGRQYQVQLPQDPGPTLRVQVTPMAPIRTMQAPSDEPRVVYSTAPVVTRQVITVQQPPTFVVYADPFAGHLRHPYGYHHPRAYRDWR